MPGAHRIGADALLSGDFGQGQAFKIVSLDDAPVLLGQSFHQRGQAAEFLLPDEGIGGRGRGVGDAVGQGAGVLGAGHGHVQAEGRLWRGAFVTTPPFQKAVVDLHLDIFAEIDAAFRIKAADGRKHGQAAVLIGVLIIGRRDQALHGREHQRPKAQQNSLLGSALTLLGAFYQVVELGVFFFIHGHTHFHQCARPPDKCRRNGR